MSACLGEVPDRSSALPGLSSNAVGAGDGDDDYSLDMMKSTIAEHGNGFSLCLEEASPLRPMFLPFSERSTNIMNHFHTKLLFGCVMVGP